MLLSIFLYKAPMGTFIKLAHGASAGRLNVSIVSVSAVVMIGSELGVLVGVGKAVERRVVVVAAVEDLVHDLHRLLLADLPHGEDGAQGAVADALLGRNGGGAGEI